MNGRLVLAVLLTLVLGGCAAGATTEDPGSSETMLSFEAQTAFVESMRASGFDDDADDLIEQGMVYCGAAENGYNDLLIYSGDMGADSYRVGANLTAAPLLCPQYEGMFKQVWEAHAESMELLANATSTRTPPPSPTPSPSAIPTARPTPAPTSPRPATTAPAYTVFTAQGTYYATENLNVRSGPDTTYDKIGSLAKNATIEVNGRANSWYRFGSDQWVSGTYLRAGQPPTPPPAQAQPPAPKPAPTTNPAASFDVKRATTVVGWIVADIATADERMLDRPEIGGATTMGSLAQDMRYLADAGMPPVADPANYYGRVTALEERYTIARDLLYADNTMEAAAAYSVARENTQTLLDVLNPVLGTSHQLPAWSW
ncbi:MAG TPA: SH3 domain-containing protein [Actinomycetaceae bacterium]|nr:SH3 domain-containing protein [Actinomycetaceae bacterium]